VNGEPKAIPRAIEAQLRQGDAGDLYADRPVGGGRGRRTG
jgi:hypothetical protein